MSSFTQNRPRFFEWSLTPPKKLLSLSKFLYNLSSSSCLGVPKMLELSFSTLYIGQSLNESYHQKGPIPGSLKKKILPKGPPPTRFFQAFFHIVKLRQTVPGNRGIFTIYSILLFAQNEPLKSFDFNFVFSYLQISSPSILICS